MKAKRKLSEGEKKELLKTLEARFKKYPERHKGVEWEEVKAKLEADPEKLWSLQQMEDTGGEPDVVEFNKESGEYIFFDCAAESPKGRRSFCYDRQALEARKTHKPKNDAISAAAEMGIALLDEEQYRYLQGLGKFDTKTSSWLKTPGPVRELGGAIFGDFRFGRVFIYHNGVQSYYSSRGFRGFLRV